MNANVPTSDDPIFVVGHFLGCSNELAAIIVRGGRQRSYPTNEVMLRRGDVVRVTHFLLLGQARAFHYSVNGQIVFLHEYHQGDIFGALGELEPAVQDSDVIAINGVRSLIFDSFDFASLAEQHACIGLALSRILLRRLQQATVRIYERSALSAVGRVYAELLRVAQENPDFSIQPPPVLTDLALQAGTTRETASRAINSLQRRGIIRRDDKALKIVAPARLEEMIL